MASPRPLSGSMIHKQDSQDYTYRHSHSYDLLQLKNTEQKQREKCMRENPVETRHQLSRVLS